MNCNCVSLVFEGLDIIDAYQLQMGNNSVAKIRRISLDFL